MKRTWTHPLAALLMTGSLACGHEGFQDEWEGDEKWELEEVPDGTSIDIDTTESALTPGCWTSWKDRDNPSGTGDWENRHLQSGVCSTPSGVQCKTTSNLWLWQTPEQEVVSCSASGGLLCLNSDQPDGVCDYDYKVRFMCPCSSCEPPVCNPGECGVKTNSCGSVNCGCCPQTCGSNDCGTVSNGCGGTMYCGPCPGPICTVGACNDGRCCNQDADCRRGNCNYF